MVGCTSANRPILWLAECPNSGHLNSSEPAGRRDGSRRALRASEGYGAMRAQVSAATSIEPSVNTANAEWQTYAGCPVKAFTAAVDAAPG